MEDRPATEDEAVKIFTNYMWWIIRRMGVFYATEDIFQEASIGLIKAFRTFDESRGVPFTSWVKVQVESRVRDYVRLNHLGGRRKNLPEIKMLSFHNTGTEFLAFDFDAEDHGHESAENRLDAEIFFDDAARILQDLLPKRDYEAVQRVMLRGDSQVSVAVALGLTESRVSQIMRDAREKLRERLAV